MNGKLAYYVGLFSKEMVKIYIIPLFLYLTFSDNMIGVSANGTAVVIEKI